MRNVSPACRWRLPVGTNSSMSIAQKALRYARVCFYSPEKSILMWSGSTDRVRRILHRRSRTKQIHAIGGQVGYRQGRTQPEPDETGPHKQPSYQLLRFDD